MSQVASMTHARTDRGLPPRLTPSAVSLTGRGEGELLKQIRMGHEQAWEMLVRRYGGRLLAVARCLLPREADARDAVQDAFLAASLSIHRFEGDEPLSSWLSRLGINAVLMRLRASPRHPEAIIEDLLPRFDHRGRHVSQVSEWPVRVHATLRSRETRARARACLDRLPLPYRVALVLRDLGKLSTGEIAAILGIGEPAVRSRVQRARLALRTLLTPVFCAAETTVPGGRRWN